MVSIDEPVEVYVREDHVMCKYNSVEDFLQDENLAYRFIDYDYIIIHNDGANFFINTRKIVHAVFAETRVELKTESEVIYISRNGIRVVP